VQLKHNYLQHNNHNMSLLERLTALFAPDECLSCRREGQLLCEDCSVLLAGPVGACFGCYTDIDIGSVACRTCLQQSGCSSIRAAVDYQGVAKQLVTSLKFIGNQSAARIMADRMLASWATLIGPPLTDVLITHVPATTEHIRQRGYDQAALLARSLAHQTGAARATLLARTGHRHQLGASRHERLAQLTGALRVRQTSLLSGSSVLLVDDVLTTGASIRAATNVLLKAGAKQVNVLVFAQSAATRTK
jgi:ComF family protein